MLLDTATLLAAISIVQLAGAITLALFWMILSKRDEVRAGSLLWWIAGLLCGSCGVMLIGVRGQIDDIWSIGLANLLLVLAVGMRRAGVASILGQSRHLWIFAAGGLLWLAFFSYPPFYESFVARVNFIQAVMVTLCLWMMYMAFFGNRDRLYSVTVLGVAAALEGAAYIWYWVYHTMVGYDDALAMFADRATTIYLIGILMSLVMTIILPVGMVIEILVLRYKEQAYQDPLTGLPNRRAFWDTCSAWRLRAHKKTASYGLVLFDIDQLKAINDSFGHAMGNAVLQLFGRVVREAIGKEAFAGRLDGEEFVVFLPGADADGALAMAQRIGRRFGIECEEASAGKLIVSAGAGVVVCHATVPPERTLEAAGRVLQKAKKLGRGQIMVSDLTKGKIKVVGGAPGSSDSGRRTAA